ncbi:MAG: SusC/RagA family TonB-linked outer membrane protein [Runella sp.]
MKLSLTQVVLMVWFCQWSFGHDTRAQEVLNRTVTIVGEQLELREVLMQIERQTDTKFVYSTKIKSSQKVSLHLVNQKLGLVLTQVLKPMAIEYEIIESRILLRKSKISEVLLPNAEGVESQPKVHSDRLLVGRVTDENGTGLPGVSIVIKGTQRGTTTDPNGQYRIEIPDANAVLVFSFVGYLPQEVIVGTRTQLDINLKVDTKALEEVVVVGYGTQTKKDLSTAISSVGTRQIKDLPISNPGQALAGQLAGVQVQQGSGTPGQAPTIRVRGTGSLAGGNGPLYVIDGYPFNDASYFNTLNPADIESVDVLKDAAAAAIYGSRGGNGVVVVTTKRGKSGKTQFSVNTYRGVSSVTKKVEVLDARQYAELATDAFRAGGVAVPRLFSPDSASQWLNTDWQDVIFRNAPINNLEVGATGGNERTRFAISGVYFGEEGIVKGTDFIRYNLNAKLDAQLTNRLKMTLDFMPSYVTRNLQAVSGQPSNEGIAPGITLGPAVPSALLMPPQIPPRYANGNYGQPNADPSLVGTLVLQNLFSPLAPLENYKDKDQTLRLWTRGSLSYQIAKGLEVSSAFGAAYSNYWRNAYRNSIISNLNFQTANLNNPVVGSIAAYQTTNKSLNWVWTNTLNYTRTFGGHTITGLLASEAQKNTFEFNALESKPGVFVNDLVSHIGSLNNADIFASSSQTLWALVSYIGRVNYNYKDRYLVSAALRRDGSSRFGPNRRFANFPSVSAAWRIANESFMRKLPIFSELKIRGSYGVTGNFEIGDFPWVATLGSDNYTFGGIRQIGYRPNGFANPDLTWETNKQTDIGVEIGLWNDRIYLTADAYERNTEGLIANRPIPTINGFTGTVVTNIGNIRNRGLEFTLTGRPVESKSAEGLRWTTSANISFNRNLVTSLVGGQTIFNTPIFGWNNTHRISEGRPLGDMYGFIMDGVFMNQAEVNRGPQWQGNGSVPGDPRYRDINNDGKIDGNDITIIGNAQPNFIYGFVNTLNWRGFDLNIIAQGVQGGQITNALLRFQDTFTGRANATIRMANRWRSESNPGDGQNPRVTTNTVPGGLREFSSRHIFDASYFRIRNVTVGYTFPTKLTQKAYLQTARLYFSVQNLATISSYFGYSPEANQREGGVNSLGIDQGTYPLPRTVTLGVNLSF